MYDLREVGQCVRGFAKYNKQGRVFGVLEPRIFFLSSPEPEAFSTWSPNRNADSGQIGPWSGVMEPWSPEISVLEPWSPGALEPWSPAFFRPEPWSPGALNPFGTLNKSSTIRADLLRLKNENTKFKKN